MTQYFDKHGTEIREGDKLRTDFSGDIVVAAFRQGTEYLWCFQSIGKAHRSDQCVVLSRADGTPILRYADGQDVRALDRYLCQGSEGTAPRELTKEMAAFDPKAWAVIVNDWAHCTLIRRAGENQLNAAIREATKPTPRCVACGSETYLCGQDGRCPECTPKTIAEAREQTTQWFVRDDLGNLKKAAAIKSQHTTDLEMGLIKCPACGTHNRVGTVHKCDSPCPDCGSPMGSYNEHSCAKNNPGTAIDHFADWLNQPTRYEQFVRDVEDELIGFPMVKAIFDKRGDVPVVFLSAPGMYETPLTPCSEVGEAVRRHLHDMIERAGNAYLSGLPLGPGTKR